ncbi:MAG TPA: hypothetical protein VK988_16880 [Acidimicrobiales bacterium]|nr:hypothetical protein [Acidimicrobiales bacterium]
MGQPARNYSWPTAERGNFIALRHGARSRRIYEPIAADLAAGLLEERPDLDAYPDALAQWAEAEARAELLRKWVAEQGMFDADQAPRSGVLTWVRVFENQAQEARKTLGLDPRSHAELVKVRAEATTQTVDIETLMARGREARLAAEQRHALETAASDSGEGSAPSAVGDAGQADDGGEGPVDGALPATTSEA